MEDVLDRNPFETFEDDKEGKCFLSFHGTCLTPHHLAPRLELVSLFDVTRKKPTIPLD